MTWSLSVVQQVGYGCNLEEAYSSILVKVVPVLLEVADQRVVQFRVILIVENREVFQNNSY